MLWSIPIVTIAGTVVRIHVTFLLFLVWIGAAQWRVGGREAALEGVVFLVLMFACVLAHEFGHIFAARRYGIRTPEVTLWPIGGVAQTVAAAVRSPTEQPLRHAATAPPKRLAGLTGACPRWPSPAPAPGTRSSRAWPHASGSGS